MVTVGRTAAALGVGGWVVLFTVLAATGVGDGGPLGDLLGWMGGLVGLSLIATWFLAIWHWGTRYPVDREGKRLWGLLVLFGFVLGSTAYWFLAVGKSAEADVSAGPAET